MPQTGRYVIYIFTNRNTPQIKLRQLLANLNFVFLFVLVIRNFPYRTSETRNAETPVKRRITALYVY